jgi:hypothetical protein
MKTVKKCIEMIGWNVKTSGKIAKIPDDTDEINV